MNHRNGLVRRCTVYTAQGDRLSQACEMPELVRAPPVGLHLARSTPLKHIMSCEITCAAPDLALPALVDRMLRERLGCIPVVDRRRHPIGIITKRDLVELVGTQLLASGSGELPEEVRSCTADDIMMPMPMTLSDAASVADAATLMVTEGFHHVLVVSEEGRLCGVVTSRDIVTWLVDEDAASSRDASVDELVENQDPARPML